MTEDRRDEDLDRVHKDAEGQFADTQAGGENDGVVSAQDDKSKIRGLVEAAEIEAMSEKDLAKRIKQLEKQMLEHARNLEFEKAARVRDQLALLREQAFGGPGHDNVMPIQAAGR